MEGKVELKNMATKFYTTLFTLNPESNGEFIRGRIPPIKEEFRQILEAGYTMAGMKGSKGDGISKSSRVRRISITIL